jgi:hypothetical protein
VTDEFARAMAALLLRVLAVRQALGLLAKSVRADAVTRPAR